MFVYCPMCESTEVDTNENGEAECADCGHIFSEDDVAPLRAAEDWDPAVDGLT